MATKTRHLDQTHTTRMFAAVRVDMFGTAFVRADEIAPTLGGVNKAIERTHAEYSESWQRDHGVSRIAEFMLVEIPEAPTQAGRE